MRVTIESNKGIRASIVDVQAVVIRGDGTVYLNPLQKGKQVVKIMPGMWLKLSVEKPSQTIDIKEGQ